MTVADLLNKSKAAHYRAQQLRRAQNGVDGKSALIEARLARAAALLADPQQEDVAWLQPMAGTKSHKDMHADLMEFYKTQGAE